MQAYIQKLPLQGPHDYFIQHYLLTEKKMAETVVHVFTQDEFDKLLMAAFSNAKNVNTFAEFKKRMEREQ